MGETARVFIGHDKVEEVAYHVASSSIIRRSTMPVSIQPVELNHVKGVFNRERSQAQSNSFSFSRFLVPYLCDYQGWALFMDCDMVFQVDIAELWSMRDEKYAVMLCKHDYTPRHDMKYLGNAQQAYPRKNWSSFMLMNCDKCRHLTPEYVETASGLDLHRFRWLHDTKIGDLPIEFNWLVGEYPEVRNPKVLHYTEGGPWFKEYRDCDYATEWVEEYKYATRSEQLDGSKENALQGSVRKEET